MSLNKHKELITFVIIFKFLFLLSLNQKSVCDCSRRNETKDTVELGQLLYEVYPMLDAEVHDRSI